MPDRRFQREPDTASRPLPGSGTVRRAGSPLVEAALALQRLAGNRSFAELVGPGVGVQREPCTDCPEPDPLAAPDTALPESDTQG